MRPKISVITPFLDAGAFLPDAIASVQGQTFRDWELLLIDDGSTDESPSIAALAAAKDPRIKVLRPPAHLPGGAAAARNIGIRAASGEFIAFLDADDLYESRMLEIYLATLNALPAVGMVYGPTRWWNADDPRADWTESMDREAGRIHRPPSLLARIVLLQMGEVPCTCGVLIRKSAVEAVGGFEERFRLYEDQTLWVKLLLRFQAYVLDYCGARYRQHPASTSARAASDGSYDRIGVHPARASFLEWVQAHVAEAGVRDRRLNLAIRLARVPYSGRSGLRAHLDRVAWRGLLVVEKIRMRLEVGVRSSHLGS
jgi:glycosyltransferase involved in cell wall biosynthesis